MYESCGRVPFFLVQVGVITDITARKSTAEAMHLCDKALAATSEATLITDAAQPDNPIIYCNSGFTKLLGAHAFALLYPFNLSSSCQWLPLRSLTERCACICGHVLDQPSPLCA
jgi:PAS domain-containing protein